jgi:regulator of protease activity HflC (stomatin/prohibitin superfamily)
MRTRILLAGMMGGLLVATGALAQSLELNFGTVNDPGGMQYHSAEEWAKRVNEALGDATAFQAVLAEYVKSPDVTRQRLYLEAMAEVLPGLGNTWIVDDSVTQLLPLLPGAAGGAGR